MFPYFLGEVIGTFLFSNLAHVSVQKHKNTKQLQTFISKIIHCSNNYDSRKLEPI